jgi:hypothetical protein
MAGKHTAVQFRNRNIEIILTQLTPTVQDKVLTKASLIKAALIYDTRLMNTTTYRICVISTRSAYYHPGVFKMYIIYNLY